jgi:hypothetical protein
MNVYKRVTDANAELAVANAVLAKAVKDGVAGEQLNKLRGERDMFRGNLLNATAAAGAFRKYPPLKVV